MISRLIVILMCLFLQAAKAQVGFLGNRFVFSVGTALAPPVNSNDYLMWDEGKTGANAVLRSDWAMFPPEINANAEFVLTKRLQVAASGSWRGLRNTMMYSIQGEYTYPEPSVFYKDSFIMRNNAIDFALNFKVFMEYAPVGKYVEFGGGMTNVTTTAYPTYITLIDYNNGEKEYFYDKRAAGTYTNKYFHADFAIGQTALLSRKILVDWGVKTSYFFGPTRYQFYTNAVSAGSYKNYMPQIIRYAQKANLQDSFIFKVYVKIGLSL